MENKLISFCIGVFLSVTTLFAQESLCVYKASGFSNTEIQPQFPLKKGDLVSKADKVIVTKGSSLTLIDKSGHVYTVKKAGAFSFKELLLHKETSEKTSVTAGYFKYVWEELTGSGKSETVIGGVFRGEKRMLFPIDSSKIASHQLSFKWKTDSLHTSYFLFIKNLETDTLLKLETNGSQISLFSDNPIFNTGKTFEWTVSTKAFPNLKNSLFYGFEVLDKEAFKIEKSNYRDLISGLEKLGLEASEIDQILCETYGLCN